MVNKFTCKNLQVGGGKENEPKLALRVFDFSQKLTAHTSSSSFNGDNIYWVPALAFTRKFLCTKSYLPVSFRNKLWPSIKLKFQNFDSFLEVF